MLGHDFKRQRLAALTSIAVTLGAPLAACRGNEKPDHQDSVRLTVPLPEEYHADNDIAMTVLSIADALKVGQPLDSAEYDYEGVLTDGQGAPLYTDVQGAPGVWVVDVLDRRNVMIKNMYLGDLLPLDLENYILGSLQAGDSARLEVTPHAAVDDDETDIRMYDIGGVYLRFEVRAGIAPNGLEGPLLSIIMSSKRPAGAGKQTNA